MAMPTTALVDNDDMCIEESDEAEADAVAVSKALASVVLSDNLAAVTLFP